MIEKDGISAGKDRKHHPGIDSYVKVFGCFVAKTDYHGHSLDSALSEPVAKVVSDCYATFISSRQAEIAEFFLKQIIDDQVLRTGILEFAAEELLQKHLINKGRNHLVAVLSHSLTAHATHTHIGLAVQHGVLVATHHVAAAVGSSAGTAAGTLLAALIIKAVMSHMGVTMAEVLHSEALHSLAMILSHKVGMAACAGVAVNFLSTHIGTAGAAAVAHALVAPVAAGVLFFTLKRLPKSMGKRVGEGVKEELAGEFRSMTSSVLRGLVKEVFNVQALGKVIANEIIGMENWQSLFDGSAVVDIPNTPGLTADMAEVVHGLNDIRHALLERQFPEVAIALSSFNSSVAGDLNFYKGDIITIIEKDDSGWWTGEANMDVGTFPSRYVKIIE